MRGSRSEGIDAGEREQGYLAFKWQASLSTDGKKQIGLGTDGGGLATGYRTEVFAKAELPTDPTAVSALWPTWEKYVETGTAFKATKPGAAFFDSATNLYHGQVFQLDKSYYEPGTSTVIVDKNPGVKAAWDLTVKAIEQGLSAKLVAARMDGCTSLGLYRHVVLPALRPAMAVLGLLSFMQAWNDFTIWTTRSFSPVRRWRPCRC